jgi:hypothetical protein
MDAAPVPLDRMLFTMVDPHRGFEVAHNRWYERDHFYGGCMIGPGWFAGQRWISPRRLKDLRFPADGPVAVPVDAGSYLAVYWMTSEDPDLTWATEQVRWLYANGRGFTDRTLVHSGIYRYLGSAHRDPDGVPVELAFDHGYPGLGVVVVEPATGTTRDELLGALDADAGALFGDDSGVDMIASFGVLDTAAARVRNATPSPEPSSALPADTPPAPGQPGGVSIGSTGGTEDRIVQLAFVEGAPDDTWGAFHAYADAIEQTGRGTVTFAAPFFAAVVGTDTYLDELW